MTDYYPLIARAIAGLNPGAPGESRRALYERAREALMAQLRSVEPALSEPEITRERLGLEQAVRKVESEAAQRARDSRGNADPVARQRYADSFQTRDALASQAKRTAEAAQARAEEDRREEEKRLDIERKEQRRRLIEIERATREQDEARRQREAQEAARIQKERDALVARAQLAMVASPAPSLAADGRLDAGPNTVYDEPKNSDDLPTLPLRQRAIIKAILSDLPGNSPTYLRTSLQSYDDELRVRGAQPILGLLKDMFEIIDAAVGDPSAQQEWLGPGLRKAFEKIAENHLTLVSHFPLDPERENLYAQTLVEENDATGHSLSEPFRHVALAAQDANKAGLTTDDFLRVVDKMAEFAKIISTLPLSAPPSVSARPNPQKPSAEIVGIRPEDRVGANQPISPKKRILLSGFGFFERAYNLLSSTVTIGGTPEGLALLGVLREAISALSNFIRNQ